MEEIDLHFFKTDPVPFRRDNVSVKDCNPNIFIKAFAQFLKLKNMIECPKWTDYVKTSPAKELAPKDPDWYFIRAAAIIRHIYFKPDCGVGELRKFYSSKQRRGTAPNHMCKASGKIIRTVLQQLERAGLLEQNPQKSGRRVSQKGANTINSFARQLTKKALEMSKQM
ncbi:small subunit ribosomal protein S19e [Babesia microti strain RI]|uniref:Small subunit ribosomal protein S19e n=1 Tax=Babesia microti (strain RI) TaxID=1133968 RepID=I7IG98_BABMR|nr:small subunit ribosomal protein S19e [Babesia microti strain RI]CCF73486.1 small subunit ribosomal protein S19e [Babesia microti strain RI]|eukprot:XP_012648095.1 small subunit ribosomal protein S19e [Babesia microti strain RI]